jgi:hypothetical protein
MKEADGTPVLDKRGCAILKTGRSDYFFFLGAAFFAGFLAADLAVAFFFSGTDFHLRSIWCLVVRAPF